MLKKLTISLLAVFLVFLSSGLLKAQDKPDTVWTLQRCIDYALKNNLTIRGGQLAVDDNQVSLTQSKADLLPTLGAGAGFSRYWGRSIDPTTNLFSNQQNSSVGMQGTSNLTLFGGFKKLNTIKRDKAALDASNYDLETDKNDIMLSVTNDFLSVILDVELLENAKVQLNTTQTQLDNTSKQVKAGALPYSNELDLIAQVESNKVQVISAENDLRLAKLQLKQLLLIPFDQAFDVEVPDLANADLVPELLPPGKVYDIAEKNMPQVKSADLNVQGAKYGIKIARGNFDPSLSFNANIYSNFSSAAKLYGIEKDAGGNPVIQTQPIGYFINPLDNVTKIPVLTDVPVTNVMDYAFHDQIKNNISKSIGFTLSIPIFNGLAYRANYQHAKIQSERADLQAQQVRLQLRQNIDLAYNSAVAADQTYEASKKQVAYLEESFRATQKSYDLGAKSYIDYQVASNTLFQAKSALLRAKYNLIFTQKVLDFYIGKPIILEK